MNELQKNYSKRYLVFIQKYRNNQPGMTVNVVCFEMNGSIVFFLFCVRLFELDELDEFN